MLNKPLTISTVIVRMILFHVCGVSIMQVVTVETLTLKRAHCYKRCRAMLLSKN